MCVALEEDTWGKILKIHEHAQDLGEWVRMGGGRWYSRTRPADADWRCLLELQVAYLPYDKCSLECHDCQRGSRSYSYSSALSRSSSLSILLSSSLSRLCNHINNYFFRGYCNSSLEPNQLECVLSSPVFQLVMVSCLWDALSSGFWYSNDMRK